MAAGACRVSQGRASLVQPVVRGQPLTGCSAGVAREFWGAGEGEQPLLYSRRVVRPWCELGRAPATRNTRSPEPRNATQRNRGYGGASKKHSTAHSVESDQQKRQPLARHRPVPVEQHVGEQRRTRGFQRALEVHEQLARPRPACTTVRPPSGPAYRRLPKPLAFQWCITTRTTTASPPSPVNTSARSLHALPQLSPTPRRQLAPGTSRHVGRSDRRDPLV